MPRKYALFFHRLSILERATDHKCINNCNEMWVGFKCNGLVIFSQRGGTSKHNTCVFPPSPPPPPSARFTSSPWYPPPSLPHPPSSVVVGRDISDSGALTGRQMGEGGGGGGKAWPTLGPTYAQLVLESWLQHTQDLLDVT